LAMTMGMELVGCRGEMVAHICALRGGYVGPRCRIHRLPSISRFAPYRSMVGIFGDGVN
jgi:hypothetical protein